MCYFLTPPQPPLSHRYAKEDGDLNTIHITLSACCFSHFVGVSHLSHLSHSVTQHNRRYAKEDGDLEALERDLNEETGWKLVHGDVFRPPSHRMLLAAVVGTGIQLVMLGLFVILLTIMGTFYEVGDRGRAGGLLLH